MKTQVIIEQKHVIPESQQLEAISKLKAD